LHEQTLVSDIKVKKFCQCESHISGHLAGRVLVETKEIQLTQCWETKSGTNLQKFCDSSVNWVLVIQMKVFCSVQLRHSTLSSSSLSSSSFFHALDLMVYYDLMLTFEGSAW